MRACGITATDRLLSIGTGSLGPAPRSRPKLLETFPLGEELFQMLQRKNGFYAFESALHVFPIASSNCTSWEEWNSETLWRNGYKDLADDLIFFAEDIVQDQFCLSARGVERFKAETGETEQMAASVEEWARVLLADYALETGWPLAATWQAAHGPLRTGARLLPVRPFFLGGEFSVENLWAGDAAEGMRLKADLAIQTRDLPEGASVRLIVGQKPSPQ